MFASNKGLTILLKKNGFTLMKFRRSLGNDMIGMQHKRGITTSKLIHSTYRYWVNASIFIHCKEKKRSFTHLERKIKGNALILVGSFEHWIQKLVFNNT